MKDLFYRYITIYLSIFIAYILLAIHSEFSNIEKDLWLYNEILFYWFVTTIQALIILWLIFIFFSLIFKIRLKNITLYFLVLLTTWLYFIIDHIFNMDNPFMYFLFYVIWFLLYWIFNKLYISNKK